MAEVECAKQNGHAECADICADILLRYPEAKVKKVIITSKLIVLIIDYRYYREYVINLP